MSAMSASERPNPATVNDGRYGVTAISKSVWLEMPYQASQYAGPGSVLIAAPYDTPSDLALHSNAVCIVYPRHEVPQGALPRRGRRPRSARSGMRTVLHRSASGCGKPCGERLRRPQPLEIRRTRVESAARPRHARKRRRCVAMVVSTVWAVTSYAADWSRLITHKVKPLVAREARKTLKSPTR